MVKQRMWGVRGELPALREELSLTKRNRGVFQVAKEHHWPVFKLEEVSGYISSDAEVPSPSTHSLVPYSFESFLCSQEGLHIAL